MSTAATIPFPLNDMAVDAVELEGVALVFLMKQVWDNASQQAVIALQALANGLLPDAHVMREQAHVFIDGLQSRGRVQH